MMSEKKVPTKKNVFVDVMAAEWIRVRTLRSTYVTLGFYVVVSLGFSLMWGAQGRSMYENQEFVDPINLGHTGSFFGILAALIFGVLSVAGEYTQGTVAGSLIAVPQRFVYHFAKLFVNVAIVAVAALFTVPTGFFITQAALGAPLGLTVTDDLVMASLIGGVLYVMFMCLLSMGLATILRSSVAAIGILLPWIVTISTMLLSWSKTSKIAQFFPDIAGSLLLSSEARVVDFTPWAGMAILIAWSVLFACFGLWFLQRRDVG